MLYTAQAVSGHGALLHLARDGEQTGRTVGRPLEGTVAGHGQDAVTDPSPFVDAQVAPGSTSRPTTWSNAVHGRSPCTGDSARCARKLFVARVNSPDAASEGARFARREPIRFLRVRRTGHDG
jgi:hypothetical protein